MTHSTDNRLRGKGLQLRRERYFRLKPLCERCNISKARELDHKIALVNDGQDVWDNLQGLCFPCHKLKTLEDMGYRPQPRIGLDGYPIEE